MIGFEESKNSVIMKEIILFGLFGLVVNAFGQTTCVDPLASPELGSASFDDNGMPCVTEGCAIPGACNFNPEADINDGTCEFTSCWGTDEGRVTTIRGGVPRLVVHLLFRLQLGLWG